MNGPRPEGLQPGSRARSPPPGLSARPVPAERRSPMSLAIGNPAGRLPYALDLARPHRLQHRPGHGREIRAGIRCSPRHRHLHRDRRRHDRPAVSAKLRRARDIDPDERVVLVITGEGLKTLDAVQGTFELTRSRRRSTSSSTGRGRGCAPDGGQGQDPDAAARRPAARASSSVDGGTVGEVLDALFDRHGELRDRLSDGDGGLRRFVNVYVDGEDIRFTRRPRDAGRRRPRGADPARGRRRLATVRARGPAPRGGAGSRRRPGSGSGARWVAWMRGRQARDLPRKRDFSATPEPAGDGADDVPDARASSSRSTTRTRLHWDLRLEHDGRARLVGDPERAPRGAEGQPPRGPHRGPPARVPRLPRRHPEGLLRRRDDAHLGPRHLRGAQVGAAQDRGRAARRAASRAATRCSRSTRASRRTG
jgi:hypothetical protein